MKAQIYEMGVIIKEGLRDLGLFRLEKAPERPYCSLSMDKIYGKDFLPGPVVTGQGAMVSN